MDDDAVFAASTTSDVSISEGSSEGSPTLSPKTNKKNEAPSDKKTYPPPSNYDNLKIINANGQIQELQTILRDKTTSRSDFIFYADRLIRLVVEEGLSFLPAYDLTITTPTGSQYEGVKFRKMNCAVSIVRSGEAMEKGLRDCCRSMRIGKILIKRDPNTKVPRVYYAKFPPDIDKRKILLLYPVLDTGATVQTAVKVLKDHGVLESNVVFVNLFSSHRGVHGLLTKFPKVTMLTSEVHDFCPSHFGMKYFGSD